MGAASLRHKLEVGDQQSLGILTCGTASIRASPGVANIGHNQVASIRHKLLKGNVSYTYHLAGGLRREHEVRVMLLRAARLGEPIGSGVSVNGTLLASSSRSCIWYGR